MRSRAGTAALRHHGPAPLCAPAAPTPPRATASWPAGAACKPTPKPHVMKQAGSGGEALAVDAGMLGDEGGHLLSGHHRYPAPLGLPQGVPPRDAPQQHWLAIHRRVQLELQQHLGTQLLGLQAGGAGGRQRACACWAGVLRPRGGGAGTPRCHMQPAPRPAACSTLLPLTSTVQSCTGSGLASSWSPPAPRRRCPVGAGAAAAGRRPAGDRRRTMYAI
jgi:hypothetical protein